MFIDRLRSYLHTLPASVLASQDLEGQALLTLWAQRLASPKLMVIDADNVARYFDTVGHEYAVSLESGVANVAPPAPSMWVEWSPGTIGTFFVDPDHTVKPPRRVGVLLVATPCATDLPPDLQSALAEDRQAPWAPHWLYEASAVVELTPDDAARVGMPTAAFDFLSIRLLCGVDAQGTLLPSVALLWPDPRWHTQLDAEGAFREWCETQWICTTKIPFLTLSFLHSKNVSLDLHTPPVVQQKVRRKAGKLPLTRYYTVHVHPPSQQRSRASLPGDAADRVPKGLHIVRGHFADYRTGAGLFGRYHGLYWMPQHVRGDAAAGLVQKTYKVHHPHR